MSIITYVRANWHAPQGYAEVLRVGLPLLAGMASIMVVQFTDRLFLSHYSMEAIAAVTPASFAALTLYMTMFGVCSYTGVLTAQYVGARAPHKVGPAIWQGFWCTLLCAIILFTAGFFAEPFFALVGHEPEIQALETQYFSITVLGAPIGLLSSSLAGFFYGRGLTKPVMFANLLAAIINIPLDYALIFGAWGVPELGMRGAALATCLDWTSTTLVLGLLAFNRENDREFHILRGWRPDREIFGKLLRYGLPSGINMFVEFAATSWFLFQLGGLGRIPQAASNIAFSINSLSFMPTIGLNMATAALVGQAMGRRAPLEAERATRHALHLASIYMLVAGALIIVFAAPLMEIFRTSSQLEQESFEQVKATGVILLYYVALYSQLDAPNLIFIGALKGAGDTVATMKIIVGSVVLVLFMPMLVLHLSDSVGLHKLWIIFTVYIFSLALFAFLRFKGRRWHQIHMV
ncbi:MAG: MATE family efflux transporter [Deltaproteobacteria bacterium]|jgi:MATE family multidrug resistance protein|nr:MATE family efflux transporter [Deltaproteobacteria bacterium]